EMVLVERRGRVAVLTLNRPEKRNALSAEMTAEIADQITGLDADDAIGALVLTGADPAFCAGFDLRTLGSELAGTRALRWEGEKRRLGLLPPHRKAIIGAINGPAVTGGLELALGCDFLIASERASFADTHARVGVMPGGGMTIRLPELVGLDRAKRMSLTGEFIDANTALAWGLVTELTSHELLLSRAVELASSIASLDAVVVAELRQMYEDIGAMVGYEAWIAEQAWSRKWIQERFDQEKLSREADAIIERGSTLS
ncbi:MAG: enoyl-CoA hydratase, partial [Actinomycetota bacterium]